ncbi:unnamed protein product [Pseudo-nitzschia multistriata]|uniref:FAD-binding domain-containing protein n=1 Tax=Pseudo-nitzschia multistriata TaxID=183589 RepID=A0A448ZCB7_9STRA|nr:unnamed protein product [Pseudo-nitzschia multistriata]
MCRPNNTETTGNSRRKRVVISGAGPAGLLLASLLLNKNKDSSCTVTYDVTLLDGREDFGIFTKEELSENHRSWMLGLADHGMDAIKTLPDLYENYVKGEGILVREFNIFLGSKKVTQTLDSYENTMKRLGKSAKDSSPPEAFIVDRNFIVAAMARYIRETHKNDSNFKAMYKTTCQYVDYDNRRVLVRNVNTKEEHYVDYDLLVGCDGVRSTVREAIVKRHSDFSMEYTDIFQEFKMTHLKAPKKVSKSAMSILPDIFPNCQGICLPETGDLVNIGIGVPRNLVDDLDDELKSDDYRVVAEYARKNFKAFELEDYDDFGKQWVGQRWNQTGMVHCNFYHSLKTGVVIMGDAAHATSPSIGMGMNTALRDAQIFSEILEETQDDFEKALPAFSEARVKEGNALSDLAMHLYCMDKKHQFIETIHLVVRSFLYSKFPTLIAEHPQTMVGRRGIALSDVYTQAVKLGVMGKHRAINDRIRMDYFERKTGMVKASEIMGRGIVSTLIYGAGLVALGAVTYQKLIL